MGEASCAPQTLKRTLQRVVLIGSSSRGGSSISAEFLRQRDDLLHLRAEINPFLRQLGLAYPLSGTGSDQLTEAHAAKAEKLWAYLAMEAGNYHRGPLSERDWRRFSVDLCHRLRLQWPTENIEQQSVDRCVEQTRERLREEAKWRVGFPDVVQFHCFFLQHLRQIHRTIDPRWYDVSARDIDLYFPDLPSLKPLREIVEEPPFVLIAPWKLATEEELLTKPLVIKTPSNAYRLPFFRRFFQHQRLDVMHLKRSAAQAINGLMDGWKYPRGFHVHRLTGFRTSQRALSFWKYDLPPGWQQWNGASLATICAHQWMCAHHWILQDKSLSDSTHSLWFQQVLEDHQQTLQSLWEWLEVDSSFQMSPLHTLPPTMATARPRQFRWFDNRDVIEPLLEQTEIQQMMEKLHEG